ncbi:MAG: hypothetical protein M1838_000184 [Thelocarpon superellum]|nr:MAG: hypothetical protein M1838_000184 [Thelocarpon superellum]
MTPSPMFQHLEKVPTTPLGKVQAFVDVLNADKESRDWDAALLSSHLRVISATESPRPAVTFRMTVTPELCNRVQNLHGGATATIFDVVTSCAVSIVSQEGWWDYTGVSRTLNVVYLGAVPEGTEIDVSAELMGIGKRQCSLRGVITRTEDGTVMATAEHGKVHTPVGSSKM